MGTSVGRALARAALAGNPSDGFGGAVLATVVPGVEAVVRASDADEVVVGDRTWRGPAGVTGPHDGDGALVAATVERLVAWCGEEGPRVPTGGVALDWSTTIPRSVGLAGSSALVIATIRALAPRWGLDLDVVTTAHIALEVETDVLGIAAGPQDRLTQAAGRTVLMDFGGDRWEITPVDPPAAVPLVVVWTAAGATPSQAVHGPLRDRRDSPEVVAAMGHLAELAHLGASALAAGDLAALGGAMDGSYEARASILDLDPAHVALVDGVRACGAPANYTGSGGAVVGLVPDPGVRTAIERWAAAGGHRVVAVDLPVKDGAGR